MKANERTAIQQFKNMLMQYDKIVLYGAGTWGELLLYRIYDWKLFKKVVFAVTNEDDMKEHLGIDVVCIDSLKECCDKYIIVVSVGNALTDELCTNLNEKNIGPYIPLNDLLRHALKEDDIGVGLKRSNELIEKNLREIAQGITKQNEQLKKSNELIKINLQETVQNITKKNEQLQKELTRENEQLQKKVTEENELLRELYQKFNRFENKLDRLNTFLMMLAEANSKTSQ